MAEAQEDPKMKPKADRVREGITILTRLREVGIGPTEPAYQEIQRHVSEWVRTGETVQAKIPVARHGRIAELLLPRRKQNTASLVLKALEGNV